MGTCFKNWLFVALVFFIAGGLDATLSRFDDDTLINSPNAEFETRAATAAKPDSTSENLISNPKTQHVAKPSTKTSNPTTESTKKKHVACKDHAACVLPVRCPAHFYGYAKTECSTPKGRKGVCCTTGQNYTDGSAPEKAREHHSKVPKIDVSTLGLLARHSKRKMVEIKKNEVELLKLGKAPTLSPDSPSYGHFRNTRVFGMPDLMDVMNVANRALEVALATRAFRDTRGISNQQLEWGLLQQDLSTTPLGHTCGPAMPPCPAVSHGYRPIDALCNNLHHPTWGAPLTPYSRLLPPSYKDGVWSPRVSEYLGEPLRSSREISEAVISDADKPHTEYTQMIMQFGQFLSHDITQSIDSTFVNGTPISCCSEDESDSLPLEMRHFACMPILVSPDDEFYSHFKKGCINFVRSVLAPRTDCTLGYAQQMNKVTHFIDGSAVYGSAPELTLQLRLFEGGKLRSFNDFGRELLPLSRERDACLTMEKGTACFEAGDSRVNQMISLVAVQTLFHREHNRLAGELWRINPHWDDEKIFREARRILTAELQVITYKEFLPALLGYDAMQEFELELEGGDKYAYDYDDKIEPSVTNEFASAAFRFGHSTVDGLLKIYGMYRMDEMISIPETMFSPGRMRKRHFFDQILSTLSTEPIQEVDSHLSDALTKYMFRGGSPFGVDLAALNIQRGRDHGLRPYNDYRQLVGLPRFISFTDFGPVNGPKLAKVYSHVDDVDLWLGGLIEEKHNGGILGTTFRDIIADQFVRLKKGDRYFFDHEPNVNPAYFSRDQLIQLRRASLSRIICDNSDGILLARQAPNAFRTPGVPGNEFVDCKSDKIQRVNLKFWKDFPL